MITKEKKRKETVIKIKFEYIHKTCSSTSGKSHLTSFKTFNDVKEY